jgi:hypothetical protein
VLLQRKGTQTRGKSGSGTSGRLEPHSNVRPESSGLSGKDGLTPLT